MVFPLLRSAVFLVVFLAVFLADFPAGAAFGDELFRTELDIELLDDFFGDFPGMRLPFVAFGGSKE